MAVKIDVRYCLNCGKKFFVRVDYNNYKRWQESGGYWSDMGRFFPDAKDYGELFKIRNPCCSIKCFNEWSNNC